MHLHTYYPANVLQYCPYCGSKKITWTDSSNCMTCTACEQKLYINAAAAVVAILFNAAGELLLTTRQRDPYKGTLDLPGGFVDLGETAECAVIREVKEELNLDVTSCRFIQSLPNRYLYKGIVYFTLDMVFECTVTNFDQIQVADDVAAYQFMPLADIDIQNIGLESIQKLVKSIQSK